MSEYQANSHKSKAQVPAEKEEKRKVQKVVTNKAKTRSNEGRKLMNVFISEDAANVKTYVFMDVLVPAIKNAIYDIVTNSLDMSLFGGSKNRKHSSSGGRVSYKSYYDEKRGRGDSEPRLRTRFDYDDIIFSTRVEVEAVREQMDEVIERYGFVTVADMYDMADLTAPYTAGKYGWTNIRSAEPVRVRDGYILKLPKAMPID